MICLYFGTGTECTLCGGSLFSIGEDGTQGPFTDVAGKRWCSEECAEEAAIFATRARAEAQARWCPACGYDNAEHAPDCPAVSASAPGTGPTAGP